MDLPESSELQALVVTVDAGSVSAAARELALPRATVSRRLSKLEERLGARLLHRTTRRIALTDAGEALYARARAILDAVDDATRAVQVGDDLPRGLLRVSVPPAASGLDEMIAAFLMKFPGVQLEVIASTRHEDLVGRGIDVAWRAGSELDPGVLARRVRRVDVGAVAAPAYLAARGTPVRAEDLADHACLVGFRRGDHPATHWPLVGGGRCRVQPRLATNDLLVLIAAARAGQGIALLPDMWTALAVERGELVRVLQGVVGDDSSLWLVTANRRLQKPAVKAFVEHSLAWAQRLFPGDQGSATGSARETQASTS